MSVSYITDSSPKSGWVKAATGVHIFEDIENCKSVKIAGSLKGSKESPGRFTIEVTPGMPLYNGYNTIVYYGSKYLTSQLASNFVPKLGHKYEVAVYPLSHAVVYDVTSGEKTVVDSAVEKKGMCRF